MTIPNEIKNNIAKDWIIEFPQLVAYTNNKLYKVVGPVVTGIEILRLPGVEPKFRPMFVCYPLWRGDIKVCLDGPLILQEFYDKRGFQLNISYLKYKDFITDAIVYAKQQIAIPLNGDVKSSDFFKMISLRFKDSVPKFSPPAQLQLFELMYYTALYVNDTERIEEILTKIQSFKPKWPTQLFESKYGSYEGWLKGLHEQSENRDKFLCQIQKNLSDKKLSKLSFSNLST
jgi:hypothetical protein